MSYHVRTDTFEGPFDLLLALVSEQKLDVGQIAVTDVADQYLAHIEALRELDMDVASDFLVVAATLLSLKAAALLPNQTVDIEDELEDYSPEETRDILVARLLAYKQFKNAAAALNVRLESEGRMHARQAGLESDFVGLLPDYLEGVTLHNLAVICADLATRRQVFLLEAEHIAARPLPVETRLQELLQRLERKKQLNFSALIEQASDTPTIVVSFLAVLELYHRGMIDLQQSEVYGDIAISYRNPEDWAPASAEAEADAEALAPDPVDLHIESLGQNQ